MATFSNPPVPPPVQIDQVDNLRIEVHADRTCLGLAAAKRVESTLADILRIKATARAVFASAPSQTEFLAALAHAEIDWSRVEAFHMDEYIGLEAGSRKSFSYFLRVHLFDLVSPGTFHVLDGLAEPTSEAQRYAQLLRRAPLDLVCCGVGENGHIAFNDPANADFQDPDSVKEVALSEESRLQQVHDGMFDGVDAVPACALTVTVPALFSAQAISCAAPGPTKRGALDRMLHGPISIECPASILRQHTNCTLYTDTEGYG